MNKYFTIVITLIVVLIVVLIALDYSGVLKDLNKANNTTTNSFVPNLVGTPEINKTLGGNWTLTTSGRGTAGNVNSFFNVLSGNNSAFSRFSISTPSLANPAVQVSSGQLQPSQSFENISGFQFSVFSPNNAGFATVGFATFGSESNANATFQLIYSNFTSSNTANSTQSKGTVSGHEYAYSWTKLTNTTLTPKNQFESLLVGKYGNNIIGIFYLTPNNESMSSFTNLYLDQISKMSSIVTPGSLSVVVSSNTVGSDIGNTWTSSLGVDIQVENASSILHEFLGSLVGTANFSSVDYGVLNQTIGNLSEVALQGYSAGNGNTTAIGFAKFLNDKVPYLGYTTAEASIGNNKNATTGTISADNVSYVYFNEELPGPDFNSTYSHNVSVLFADYNDYVIYISYIGTAAVSQSQFVGLLTSEIGVI